MFTPERLKSIPRWTPSGFRPSELKVNSVLQETLNKKHIPFIRQIEITNAVLNYRTGCMDSSGVGPSSFEKRARDGCTHTLKTTSDFMRRVSTSKNTHFQCGVLHFGNPVGKHKGCIMKFNTNTMNRSGVQLPSSALRVFNSVNNLDTGTFMKAMSVANYVLSVRFTCAVSRHIIGDYKVNTHKGKFSALKIMLDSVEARDINATLHLGFDKNTGVQSTSMATVAGLRDLADIERVVVELSELVSRYVLE
jgi:hypothetical protein